MERRHDQRWHRHIDGPQALVTIDRRTMPGEDPEEILECLLTQLRLDIGELSNADWFEVNGGVDMEMPGFRSSPDSRLVRVAREALLALGQSALVTGWTAACEGGFFARMGVPTVVLGPGDVNAQAHQPNEEVSISDLVHAAHAYVLMGLRLAAGEQATGVSELETTVTRRGWLCDTSGVGDGATSGIGVVVAQNSSTTASGGRQPAPAWERVAANE